MKQVVKANGVYPLNHKHSASRSALYVAGTTDGATIGIVTYVSGIKVPLKDTEGTDIMMESGSQLEVNHGTSQRIYADIAGGGGSVNLTLVCEPLR